MHHQRDVEDADLSQRRVHVADIAMVDAVKRTAGRLHRLFADVWTERVDALLRVWRREVLRHPGFYLIHRAKIFALYLGFGKEPWTYTIPLTTWENPPEFYRSAHAHFTPSVTVRAVGQMGYQCVEFYAP
jgi:hypothetical protein